ncbi:peptidoglycan DD-metalloendopeptidase family protein [Rhodococcus sp. BP-252]|nr:peptidoglycan DD-metalloendopeptidase family protein [Rhodococcus sp. BP-320]MBY6417595.1 peptidoglycan DD-metalloendopeptidase family protein [Rhodococcus sp. BP-321]MBY6423033.1 peptidoglycan DD-metalloendopeptidase family protein [Rhodococcus sp. BP-324]MBY6427619.1 peptidoglycan DD-metalloendopeptidase family protein [Rhodococcus sp. BP-323]MBY6432783.1 peptidoglycan DD-metalloendopeptidase family protein [Rhodococcus sp. BP-322]MBY6441601.1 peptidoglycan DD-metalloendopeptidase family 
MFGVLSGDRTPKADEGTCLPAGPSTAPHSGTVVMPLREGTYQATSPFGPRINPVTGEDEGHQGQDYSAPAGTPIYAATDGTVVKAGPANGFGNWIIIDSVVDGQSVSTVYGHMNDDGIDVTEGQILSAGDPIGAVGNAGQSTGPHLHFEVWPGTRLASGSHAVDPVAWLASAGANAPAAPDTAALAAEPATTTPWTVSAPKRASSRNIALAAAVKPGCGQPAGTTGLRPGSVPAEFEPWIVKAGTVCAEVTAPILAAQLEQESGFNTQARNPSSGADGPAQFMPATWAAKAVDGDGDGRKDTRSIADAVTTQASYECELAGMAKDGLASGKLRGDLTKLYLSMYNCGPGATLSQGQVCQNAETLDYVAKIPKTATEKFAVAVPDNGPGLVPGGPFGTNVVAAAMAWLGTTYAWGGGDRNGPTKGVSDGGGRADMIGDFDKVGFDCSGLVLYAVAQASGGSIILPHQDSAQIADPRGRAITTAADLQPGDIIQPHSGHIFIWLGGGQVVEAPQSGDVVKISDWTPPTSGLTARRFG